MRTTALLPIAGVSVALLAGCASKSDGSGTASPTSPASAAPRGSAVPVSPSSSPSGVPAVTASSSAAPPAGSSADAADLDGRIRAAWAAQKVHTVASTWPEQLPSGAWKSPGGKIIAKVFVVGRSRPAEQDGWPFTAYVSTTEKLYWVHEGGGISGINRWYGPFPVP